MADYNVLIRPDQNIGSEGRSRPPDGATSVWSSMWLCVCVCVGVCVYRCVCDNETRRFAGPAEGGLAGGGGGLWRWGKGW